MNEKIPFSRLGGWVMVAMSAPFAYVAGRQNWTAVLLVSSICLPIYFLVYAQPANKILKSPILCVLEFAFLVIVGAEVSGWSASVWPTGSGWPVVPITLVVLATVSAWFGPNRASKGVGVLFWIVTILYSILLAFGLQNIKPQYLLPQWQMPSFACWFIFLLPCVGQFLPREGKGKWLFGILGLVGIVATVWAEGVLSLAVAKQTGWPFYTAGEGSHIFGVANRLESFISVGVTIGFYGLYSLIISATGYVAENLKTGYGRYGAMLGGILSITGAWMGFFTPDFVLVLGAFVLWIALPIAWEKFLEK